MKHGYTNETERNGSVVRKVFLGPDAERRRRREVAALQSLRGRLPVPRLLSEDDDGIVTEFVAGVPGQEALDAGEADMVLGLCGQLLRQVQSVERSAVTELGLPRRAEDVLVHGDFGPQNIVIDPAGHVVALVDWEWTHVGNPIKDLAWAEWIVRTHHRDLTDHLDSLFDGYGDRPAWEERHAAMIRRCEDMVEFTSRWELSARELWEDRARAAQQLVE